MDKFVMLKRALEIISLALKAINELIELIRKMLD